MGVLPSTIIGLVIRLLMAIPFLMVGVIVGSVV